MRATRELACRSHDARMDKNDIELGKHYAIREHPNDDLQHVKIVESVRSGKWRAEWIDPNPGLVDYVASRTREVDGGSEATSRSLTSRTKKAALAKNNSSSTR